MTQATLAWKRPLCGQANQIALDLSAALAGRDEVGLIARKGMLYLLSPNAKPSSLNTFARRYYEDPSFDILPTLARALRSCAETDADEYPFVSLAIVVCGLDFYCVGTEDAAVWLVRGQEASPIPLTRVPALEAASSTAAETRHDTRAPALYSAQRRLGVGDAVIATIQPAMQPLSLRALARITSRGTSMSAVARAVAKLATRGQQHMSPAPAIALRIPGFEPIPDLGPVQGNQPLPAQQQTTRPRQFRSPIWVALGIAALAIVASIMISKPSVSPDVIDHVVMWLLTPAPTGTPTGVPIAMKTSDAAPSPHQTTPEAPSPATRPAPVATSHPTLAAPSPPTSVATPARYPLPVLVYPSARERVCERPLRLRWSWLSILAPGEYYDVRVWRVGETERSIAWTVEQEYELSGLDNGWHYWRVVVIRGSAGVIERELSSAPIPISFLWECDEPIPTPLLRAPR